jgi:DNA-directed RNA polymerase specialized sigma24 family protein
MPSPPPAALLAFLRGLERRARTLAEAQCGDADRAARIWADTAAAFPGEAAVLPVAAWPVRFWARLLAHPDMAVVEASTSPLAALGPGPRAAILLRLVAGLDPRPAADVLGVSEPTYRYALQRGLEQARAAGIDADALQALRSQWQRQPTPTAPRPQAFAAAPVREADLAAQADVPVDFALPTSSAPPPKPQASHRSVGMPWVVGSLALVLLLGIGWWLAKPASELPAPPPVEELAGPPGEPPPLSPVTHPDFALVANADDVALADDLDLLSWLAAGADAATAAAPAPGATP